MSSDRQPVPAPFSFDDDEDTVRIALPTPREQRAGTMPTLKVVAGPGQDMLRFWPLSANERLVVGRDENVAGVVLSDATVSKRHAVVATDEQGGVMVEDLNSTNGTAINGKRIVDPTPLPPNENLEIGGVLLRLELLSDEELSHLGRVARRLAEAGSDPLTRLRTRAFVNEELPHLVQRCRQSQVPLSCAFLDLDRFKSINDLYGHHVGDEVLARTSRIILGDVRDEDACVRYGGEEIVLFLPGSSLLAASGVAERLRRKIADHDWYRTAPELRVTASVGVAELKSDEDVDHWIRRADKAMYRAKAMGKNRVCRAD
ncbi:MAG: GGDEF domain-containing protein [Alphaproteobacteria bacterium]|nr:GGDEF domain-containing protein [Alphaproteobacteria bacterium]